jgi:hypothetical protein
MKCRQRDSASMASVAAPGPTISMSVEMAGSVESRMILPTRPVRSRLSGPSPAWPKSVVPSDSAARIASRSVTKPSPGVTSSPVEFTVSVPATAEPARRRVASKAATRRVVEVAEVWEVGNRCMEQPRLLSDMGERCDFFSPCQHCSSELTKPVPKFYHDRMPRFADRPWWRCRADSFTRGGPGVQSGCCSLESRSAASSGTEESGGTEGSFRSAERLSRRSNSASRSSIDSSSSSGGCVSLISRV